MSILEEVKGLQKTVFSLLALFLAFSSFFFFFGLRDIHILEKSFLVPFPSGVSFAVVFFENMRATLVPPGVELLVTSPFSAFVAEISVALFLGFLATFPFLLYKIMAYIRPALYPREKKILYKAIFPSLALFAAGCFFAYFIIIPPAFTFLYAYAGHIGATAFFSVNEFITWSFTFMFVTGLFFLLPVFMISLTRFGIVAPHFWREKWRVMLFAILAFSAIITPDGSGITMFLLSLPVAALYGLGAYASARPPGDRPAS